MYFVKFGEEGKKAAAVHPMYPMETKEPFAKLFADQEPDVNKKLLLDKIWTLPVPDLPVNLYKERVCCRECSHP